MRQNTLFLAPKTLKNAFFAPFFYQKTAKNSVFSLKKS
jgi:hypothetical protein